MELPTATALVIGATIGMASGAIGAFVILQRMALVGDALSHVALPGIALALFYHVEPFWGVLAFLLAAAVTVWWLQGQTTLPSDALVGILFTTSLAVGVLTIPNDEILHSLFGEFPTLATLVFVLITCLAVTAMAATIGMTRRFLFRTITPDLAQVQGIGRTSDLLLLCLFAVIVSLGIKLVGTLLMGALTIIPASIAKNLAASMKSFVALSTLLGAFITVAGLVIAKSFHFAPGPSVILFGIGVFVLSLLVNPKTHFK